ncbi:MAG: hypothetical protein B0D92_07605 [Spirochaeta sp. LUC14_002_19_P3]|nr:MAG: hypothetical protein B0D92_07605 [Spirochaeta sp. LUC14_002_19_P3]
MHFEFLVEDKSGKEALEILVPEIIGDKHTYKVFAYKGIGRIPSNMTSSVDARNRLLLDNLPQLLNGYGRAWQDCSGVVFMVCDLDNKCLKSFRQELLGILSRCNPRPETRFCIAVEEGEAWFLGDISAVKAAYPKAKDDVLNSYENDSICGTWEKLADAVYPGGSSELSKKGWQVVGKEKSEWAKNIAPKMNVAKNASPSFNHFRSKLQELASQ